MTQALTLTEAAERLAPVFAEEQGASVPATSMPKGKWMSLEHAGAILAERVTGRKPVTKKAAAEVTIKEAAQQIEHPKPATLPELPEVRAKRLAATATKVQRWTELEEFTNRAIPHFQGMDDAAVLASPDFQAVYSHALQLRAVYEASAHEEQEAWNKQCVAETAAFELERPEWSAEDARRVAVLLAGLGVPEQEQQQLWLTPQPINVASPICMTLAQMSVGIETPEPIHAALAAVGFEDEDVKAVMAGETPILLRDHRIQELVARAADAHTPTKDRKAA